MYKGHNELMGHVELLSKCSEGDRVIRRVSLENTLQWAQVIVDLLLEELAMVIIIVIPEQLESIYLLFDEVQLEDTLIELRLESREIDLPSAVVVGTYQAIPLFLCIVIVLRLGSPTGHLVLGIEVEVSLSLFISTSPADGLTQPRTQQEYVVILEDGV